MLDIIIFSKNRAAQLNLLLKSLKLNFNIDGINNIFIIHTYTNLKFRDGYFKLMGRGFKKCVFVSIVENNFRNEIIYFLESIYSKYILIITDDSIIYKRATFNISDIDKVFTDDVLNLSLRMGLNTYVADCNKPDILSKIPKLERIECSHFIKWNWKNIYGNSEYAHFNFPFYMDGMTIRRGDLITFMKNSGGHSMRSIEAYVSTYISTNSHRHYMVSPFNSILVSSPNNMVADDGYLPNGLQYPYTIEELNEKYLKDTRIYIDSNVNIKCVLQELPFIFKEK